ARACGQPGSALRRGSAASPAGAARSQRRTREGGNAPRRQHADRLGQLTDPATQKRKPAMMAGFFLPAVPSAPQLQPPEFAQKAARGVLDQVEHMLEAVVAAVVRV